MERSLILLLRLDLIRRAKLLHCRRIQPHAFLHLGRNDEPAAFQFCHLRLDISLAVHGQCFRRQLPGVIAQDSEDRVPESRFTVGTATIGNDHVLLIDLPDRRHSDHQLYIIDQLLILAEEKLQGIQPQLLPIFTRCTGCDLRDQVSRIMRLLPGQAFLQVIGSNRCIDQELILVQVIHVDPNHRFRGIPGGNDVLVIAPLQHKLQISLRCHERIQKWHLIRRDLFCHSLRSTLNNRFRYPGIDQRLLRIFLILLGIHQLQIKELFDRTDGQLHILHPAFAVISEIIRSR